MHSHLSDSNNREMTMLIFIPIERNYLTGIFSVTGFTPEADALKISSPL